MDRLHLKYNTATTLYFYIYNTNTYSGGEPVTGLGSSASCSYTIDGGSPTSTGTTVSELSSSYNPGVYKVVCTSAVTNGDVIIMSLFYSAGNRADPLTIYTDKTAGNLWKTNVPTAFESKIDTIDTVADAILVDTGTSIPADITSARNEIAVIDAAVDTEVAAIKTVVDAILVDTATTLNDKIDVIDGIVDAILVDTGTTIPASTISANVTQVSGSSTAADNMELGALSMVAGISHNSPTPTTEAFASDTGALSSTNNFYNGRILIFTSGTLAGQARTILDYTGSSKLFTCDAFTAAPPNDSNFIIV